MHISHLLAGLALVSACAPRQLTCSVSAPAGPGTARP